MTVNERIERLRHLMAERNIDIYIIPTADFHNTEFVGEHFKERKYMSGFSGSDGTLLVTSDASALWVDGRYFLQAAKELSGTEIQRMEIGEPGVPQISEYVKDKLPQGGTIAFDGRTMNTADYLKYKDIVTEKGGNLYTDEDLVDIIWEDRPPLPKDKVWLLTDEQAGEGRADKINRLREYMSSEGYDMILAAALDEVAWLMNIRGGDISYFPVVMAYAAVTFDEAALFVDMDKLTDDVALKLEADGVDIYPYEEIYSYAKNARDINIGADFSTLNSGVYSRLSVGADVTNIISPIKLWKAVKNITELANTKKAHIRDGAAVTKFIYRIKKEVASGKQFTELDAADILLKCRMEQDGFIEPSFETIAAYGSNAAYVHYSAKEDDQATLKPEGLLLVDSGGHYTDGTTDVTRTIALGDITDEQKKMFTAVLKGMIRLSMARFPEGVRGYNLDAICRGHLWSMGLDYRHGTGHGVGHIGAVHEGPNAFRWRRSGQQDDVPMTEGMITSNEPGYYKDGEYGIRIENEIVAVKDIKTEYGQFMRFDTLTYVPIDREAIKVEMLTEDELSWLNDYHKKVYDNLKEFMNYEERKWLSEVTADL